MAAEEYPPAGARETYLLDTSTLLWLIMEPSRLSETAKSIWQNPQELVAVSVVSYWEVAIKANKKVLQIDNVAKWWGRRVMPYIDLEIVAVREEHISELLRLPHFHKDPFDRMLIAQTRTENMVLITSDARIREYPVRTIW